VRRAKASRRADEVDARLDALLEQEAVNRGEAAVRAAIH